jgi:hypothetical protein
VLLLLLPLSLATDSMLVQQSYFSSCLKNFDTRDQSDVLPCPQLQKLCSVTPLLCMTGLKQCDPKPHCYSRITAI